MKKTLTFDEACEYLNTSTGTLTDLIAVGEVPAGKIGKRFVLRESDLDAYLAEQISAQTEARRQAFLSGKQVKVQTAAGAVRARKYPALPPLPEK